MPGFDGTGPQGLGPMTGGARGYCAQPVERGWSRPFGRRFFGRGAGRGGGRGWRNWYYTTGLPGWARAGYGPYIQEPTPEEEVDILKQEAQGLKQELEDIQSRISTLEKAQLQEGE